MGIGIGSKLKNEIKWFLSAMAIIKSIFDLLHSPRDYFSFQTLEDPHHIQALDAVRRSLQTPSRVSLT